MTYVFEIEKRNLLRLGVRLDRHGVEWRLTYLDGTGERFAEIPAEALALGQQMAQERPYKPPVMRRRRGSRFYWMTQEGKIRAPSRAHNRQAARNRAKKPT